MKSETFSLLFRNEERIKPEAGGEIGAVFPVMWTLNRTVERGS